MAYQSLFEACQAFVRLVEGDNRRRVPRLACPPVLNCATHLRCKAVTKCHYVRLSGKASRQPTFENGRIHWIWRSRPWIQWSIGSRIQLVIEASVK